MKKVISTQRLYLREFEKGDASFILELLNCPSWLQMIGDRKVYSTKDAVGYIENKLQHGYKENGFGSWAVCLKTNEQPIGMCGLIKRETLEDVDIGFAFLPEYEGMGYAYEAAMATLEIAPSFSIETIAAITTDYNHASVKLLNKLGLTFKKHIRIEGDEEELMYFSKQLLTHTKK